MSAVGYHWSPTPTSVENKNKKWQLVDAIFKIWNVVENCKDKKTKKEILEILTLVL